MNKGVVLSKPYRLNPIVIQWVEALATCAIEGNQLGIEMLELSNSSSRPLFQSSSISIPN